MPARTKRHSERNQFVPALGFAGLTPLYDAALAIATREQVWRPALAEQVAPRSGETIIDVGCGTGTLAIMLKRREPDARVVGIDPDPEALTIAERKATREGLAIEWRQGFAREAAAVLGPGVADKAVSSLVFHQVPMLEKKAGVTAMFDAVRPGGEVHIADYARQSGASGLLFTVIELLDGFANTRPNADGAIEELLSSATGFPVQAWRVVPTATGAISLFACSRPITGGFHE